MHIGYIVMRQLCKIEDNKIVPEVVDFTGIILERDPEIYTQLALFLSLFANKASNILKKTTHS